MTDTKTHALSDVLDQLERSAEGESVPIRDVVDRLGPHSFAALMLIFSLISTSPASAIPGITATVGLIVGLLVIQMIVGRKSVWLPDFVTRRELPSEKVRKGIGWLRRPVRFVEGYLGERLTWFLHRPWLLVPLVLILALSLFMPLMEVIPTSGSIASAVIALFAAGLLARDGVVAMASMVLLLAVPVTAWYFGFRA